MKKILVLCVLLCGSLSVVASDLEVNLTPRNNFSGYSNSPMKTDYPHLNSKNYQYNNTLEQQRKQWMKPTSVRSMNINQEVKDNSVYLNRFPDSYDSSDMMRIQQIQNGVQNMYMGL